INNSPGLMRATFKGGYTIGFYKADATTGQAQEAWHNQANDAIVANPGNIRLGADRVIFQWVARGGGRGGRGGRGGGRGGRGTAPGVPEPPLTPEAEALGKDEWERYYSIDLTNPSSRPVLLTTTDGMIENPT